MLAKKTDTKQSLDQHDIADLSISERLRELVPDRQVSESARRCGIAQRTFASYLQGTMPTVPKLVQLAEGLGVNLAWLATGVEPKFPPDKAFIQPFSDQEAPGFTLVPRLDVEASAGPGALAHNEQAIDYLAFQESWLRARKINPSYARVLTAKGDSMEPTIRNGDVLLVDTSINHILDNTIYVIVYGDILLVKRVHSRLNGTVQLISDNPLYPPEEVTAGEIEQLHVAGRVMWFGRSI
ncbi:XRE family transcriptional regulator [Brucella pseudogrignonensis]|uniref:XRE family transcriptional regulator n=1 Tax=Brucella pseudogrignonensis TaxID=419475 RepID=UPI001F1CB0C4|nr:helix-turn-helix transcriptional regulator [Brucella pseudogrignonensis]